MDKPIVASINPAKVELKEGQTYFFCTCGRSETQPFCNGAHKGTTLVPMSFKAEQQGDAYLCLCKQSKNMPYCDGSHKACSRDRIGQSME